MNRTTIEGLLRSLTVAAVAASLLLQRATAEEPARTAKESEVSHARGFSREIRRAAEGVTQSVVLVETLRGPRETPQWRNLSHHGGRPDGQSSSPPFEPSSAPRDERGSGVIIDGSGVVLTCHHVVARADVVFVTLPDGRRYEPLEIRSDPDRDVAVLLLPVDSDLPVANLGDSDEVQMGDWVVSVGNPYGLERSVSVGTVAASRRNTPLNSVPLIQSDASSNPGSSGGALANLRGDVIGMLSGSIGVDDGFQGVGLAIPIKEAQQAADYLMKEGSREHFDLGCDLQPISPLQASHLNLPKAGGFYVLYVGEGTPASEAGLRVGDFITRVDGQPIDAGSPPRQVVEGVLRGQSRQLTVYRQGRHEDLRVPMNSPPTASDAKRLERRGRASLQGFCELLGMSVGPLTPGTARLLGYPPTTTGALITEVELRGVAYKDGIAAGMLVVRVNDHDIENPDDFHRTTKDLPPEKPVLMLIASPDRRYLTVLEL